MFASLGVGAWVAAIFHLMTHGFFKGLLFLGSGSVIHAVHEEQDMRKMGGLRKKIPITYRTMLIGAIAISGIPPLAGFFSKDEILGESFKNGLHLGLGDRHPRRGHDRVLHVPAHRAHVLGQEPGRPDGRAEDPRVAADDDRAAVAARDPVGPARHRPELAGPAARAAVRDQRQGGPARELPRSRSSSSQRCSGGRGHVRLGGIDGAPARDQHRRRASPACSWHGACSASRSGRSRAPVARSS